MGERSEASTRRRCSDNVATSPTLVAPWMTALVTNSLVSRLAMSIALSLPLRRSRSITTERASGTLFAVLASSTEIGRG